MSLVSPSNELSGFLASMTFSQPAGRCDRMGCTHDHLLPVVNKNSTMTLKAPSAGTVANPEKITELDSALAYAKKKTEKRIRKIEAELASDPNHTPTRKVERLNRLQNRLKDIEAIPRFLEDQHLRFKGFSGWDKRNVLINNTKSNISQFESVIAETQDHKEIRIPLCSRYQQIKGKEIDLLEHQIKHEDHTHTKLDTFSLQKMVDQSIQWTIGEDEEGCPCCVAGLDFDEFAAALKEVSRSGNEAEQILSQPDFTSVDHWGIALGIAAPLGLVGLAAAMRNIDGSIKTRHHIKTIIKGLDQDIKQLEEQKANEDVKKLYAFKKCLEYSKFDAEFNLIVPGVINGISSSLVLTTVAVKHPFALPVIALYAAGQFARNTYDFTRVWHHKTNPVAGDALAVLGGKKKINRIANEKRNFYASNATGFAAFAAGAVLTFIALPAMGLFGAGAPIFAIGLSLLSFGAVSTGVMNNIWPRKFKPRNGDLGISRIKIRDSNQVIEEIYDRRQKKKIIQSASPVFKGNIKGQKRWLKFLTALPEAKDFLSKKPSDRWVQFRKREGKNRLGWLWLLLWDTGSQASSKKHALNIKTIQSLHDQKEQSLALQQTRIAILKELLGKSPENPESSLDQRALLKKSWHFLKALKLEKNVLETWLNEGFADKAPLTHTHHAGCCGSHHLKQSEASGFEEKSSNWSTFNFEKFVQQSDDNSLKNFNAAVDYFIFYQYEKTLKYQQYGLNDYYWQLRDIESNSAAVRSNQRIVTPSKRLAGL